MKVFMIRHGESETNKKNLLTGWLDALLTEQGKAEAEQVGKRLSSIKFDKVYTSDLSRARETAAIALPTCECETVAGIREIDIGSFAGKPKSSLCSSERELVRREGYQIFGGESREEFGDRVRSFMKLLEGQDCKNIAVFTHAGVLRKAFEIVLGIVIPYNVLCNNCAIAVFEYNNSQWSLHSWTNLD